MMMPAAINFTVQNNLPKNYRNTALTYEASGMAGLGVAPVLIAVGGGAVVAGGKYAVDAGTPWYHALAQWAGWEGTPELIVNPGMPGNRAPVAPQTAAAMKTWSLDYLDESTRQRNAQYNIDYMTTLARNAQEQVIGAVDPANPGGLPTWAYLAGIGAVLGFFALKR